MSVHDDVPRTTVRRILEAKATNTQRCPVCKSKIGTTISLEHDRACTQCPLLLWIDGRDDDDNPEYRVDMDTTPEGRIRKSIQERAMVEGMKQALGGETESE